MGAAIRRIIKNKWKENKKRDMQRIASQTPVKGVMQIAAVPYLKDDEIMHTLNVYYPKHSTSALPTIIDIHGGGWMYGDRDLNKHYCMFLASKGFAVVSMSYRLLPYTDLKGQVQDIFASYLWLSENARSYHCDLSSVFLTGDSAGGHLAALTYCIIQNKDLQKKYDVKIPNFTLKAIALSHPVCDVYHLGFTKGWFSKSLQKEMLLMMIGKDKINCSIVKKMSFAEVSEGVGFVPVMLISSEADALHFQSLQLLKQLKELNAPVQTLFSSLENGGEKLTHVYHILYPHWPESENTNTATIEFFKKYQ